MPFFTTAERPLIKLNSIKLTTHSAAQRASSRFPCHSRCLINALQASRFRAKAEAEQQIWYECSPLIANAIIYYNTLLLSRVYEQKVGVANGSYILVPSPGYSYVPVNFQYSAAASGAPIGNQLITGQTLGTIRNNFSGFVGMQFTTTGALSTVRALGRVCAAGNSGMHLLKLAKSDGTDLPGGSATVMMAGCTADAYKYVNLPAPLQLNANTTYLLVSQELLGGDHWYDYAAVTPVASVTAVNGPVYFAGVYNLVASPGSSYVPVNLLYQ